MRIAQQFTAGIVEEKGVVGQFEIPVNWVDVQMEPTRHRTDHR